MSLVKIYRFVLFLIFSLTNYIYGLSEVNLYHVNRQK